MEKSRLASIVCGVIRKRIQKRGTYSVNHPVFGVRTTQPSRTSSGVVAPTPTWFIEYIQREPTDKLQAKLEEQIVYD